MIYGHAKWLNAAFALTARDAARRFVRHRGKAVSGRGSWRPIVLRWRQTHNRREKMSTGRAAPAAKVLLFAPFHFHFAMYRSDPTRRDRVAGFLAAARTPEARVVLDHHWTSVRTSTRPRQPRPASRRLPPFRAHISWPKSRAGLTPAVTVLRRPTAHSIAPPTARRPQVSLFGRISPADRGSKHREERPVQMRSGTRQHWLQVVRMTLSTSRNRVPDRSHQSEALRVQFGRPEDLVWRRMPPPSTDIADDERHQLPSESIQRLALRNFQIQDVANVSTHVERAAPLQITNIDPSLWDRLTDDVIRRVEKRAQIDRQRRGL